MNIVVSGSGLRMHVTIVNLMRVTQFKHEVYNTQNWCN